MVEGHTERTEPIVVDRGAVIHTQRRVYTLHSDEFLKLTKIPSFLAIWAHGFFAGTGVFALTVLSRWVDQRYFDGDSPIESWEWILLTALVVLVGLLEGSVFLLPSERKHVTKKIERFFKDDGDGDD
jgi:hypothetical protein